MPPSLGSARAAARADFVRQRLSAEVGEEVIVEVASDYGDMVGAVRAGAAHFVWAPAVVCARLPEPRAVLKAVRHGRSTYHSAIVARRDRHLRLGELRGARAAWVDRDSVGGYRLALQALRERGLDGPPALAEQRFVESFPAVVEAVLTGAAEIGAVYVPSAEPHELERALVEHRGARGQQALEALLVLGPVPNDAFVITSVVPEDRARAIEMRLFPPATNGHGIGPGRPPSLCVTMDVDGFARAGTAEYATLRRMLGE